jgi:D-glycero-D-manno-heptose 1,7-bisphosphate phosphatase
LLKTAEVGLTATTPKPLLPVGGSQFLDVLLFELGRQGIMRIPLFAGFAAAKVREYALATPLRARFGLTLELSVERC